MAKKLPIWIREANDIAKHYYSLYLENGRHPEHLHTARVCARAETRNEDDARDINHFFSTLGLDNSEISTLDEERLGRAIVGLVTSVERRTQEQVVSEIEKMVGIGDGKFGKVVVDKIKKIQREYDRKLKEKYEKRAYYGACYAREENPDKDVIVDQVMEIYRKRNMFGG